MPVTLPAHAAAVLPLVRLCPGLLPPAALVCGSVAPDIAYLLGIYGVRSHVFPSGLLTWALPFGLGAYLWAQLLVLPMLERRLPRIGGVELARVAAHRGLPRRWSGWIGVVAAVLIGAVTHQLWDGLTHANAWPARVLYPGARVELPWVGAVSLARVLWVASSVAGSALVLWVLARAYPRLPPVGASRRDFTPLGLALVAGIGFGLLWRFRFPLGGTGWMAVWSYFWAAARYGCVALTALALVDRLRDRRSR